MQILPQTAEFLAHRSGATTFTSPTSGRPQVNIAYGSYYLRYLLDEYHGNEMLALAAYNGGETNVDRWLATAHDAGQHADDRRRSRSRETRAYVEKVLQAQQRLPAHVRDRSSATVARSSTQPRAGRPACSTAAITSREPHRPRRRVERRDRDPDPRRRVDPEALAGHHQPAGIEQRPRRPAPPRAPGPRRSGPSVRGRGPRASASAAIRAVAARGVRVRGAGCGRLRSPGSRSSSTTIACSTWLTQRGPSACRPSTRAIVVSSPAISASRRSGCSTFDVERITAQRRAAGVTRVENGAPETSAA